MASPKCFTKLLNWVSLPSVVIDEASFHHCLRSAAKKFSIKWRSILLFWLLLLQFMFRQVFLTFNNENLNWTLALIVLSLRCYKCLTFRNPNCDDIDQLLSADNEAPGLYEDCNLMKREQFFTRSVCLKTVEIGESGISSNYSSYTNNFTLHPIIDEHGVRQVTRKCFKL